MLNKKYILFDLDGTLTDPGEGITNSVAYSLAKFGIIINDNTSLYKFIGPPLWDSFRDFYGFDDSQAKLAVDYYREYYREKGIFENKLYQGVPELLASLRAAEKIIILATSKPKYFADKILDYFGLSKFFDYTAGSELDGTRVKKDEVISYALNKMNITDPKNAVMVGDREHDIIGAGKNHMQSVGVLYGYGTKEELEKSGADHIAGSIEELVELLR